MSKRGKKPKIRVLLASCELLCEQMLQDQFKRENDIEIIQSAEEINEVLELIEREKPDIIIMCHSILNEMGLDLVSTIKKSRKHIKFIVFCRNYTPEQELMMLRKGISGIVSHKIARNALLEVVRKVYSGDIWIRRETLNAIVESDLNLNEPKDSNGDNLQLTTREKEILALIGTGCSNPEIAHRLFISETTVKSHISHIYKKMNIHDRLEAAILAKNRNISSS